MADLVKNAGANRVLTMDLHSDSMHRFFSMPVDHLTAIPIIAEYIQQNIDLSSKARLSLAIFVEWPGETHSGWAF